MGACVLLQYRTTHLVHVVLVPLQLLLLLAPAVAPATLPPLQRPPASRQSLKQLNRTAAATTTTALSTITSTGRGSTRVAGVVGSARGGAENAAQLRRWPRRESVDVVVLLLALYEGHEAARARQRRGRVRYRGSMLQLLAG